MKKITFLLLAASLLPSCVLAWNTPGEDFSGELILGGPVTSTRNPWVWKIGEGNESLDVRQVQGHSGKGQVTPVSLPEMAVLLGKTTQATPSGREGLSPRVNYGKTADGFKLEWVLPGMAEVTLPVTGEDNSRIGSFSFRMQAVAVMRHTVNGRAMYAGLYENLKGNGLPEQAAVMSAEQIPGKLQAMFGSEGPLWLQDIGINETIGLSSFSDAALHQIEGVYGAQVVPGSGELRLADKTSSRWRVSLPVSIEYQ
ncbi:fimbrial protein [Salmonella enterica]|uniref:Fimbrial protein n=2 Tax=Salmonella enterica TaxID=28901 RepID=A0A7Z1PMQ3_SALET|nr:fimbrial protein [Salmonella enterica]EAA7928033.1 fimbrial protein [Salmonella enterica subsp. enterica serovar Redlands]EAB9741674.1 fimbrial protein [Salmonella enterica subsp. diarizonae]ECG1718209.1 fimbrial protein [Salmonella enterica subsp. diarizonae serovar 17:z10:e,n,x,z15]EDW0433246.1 fimbrial protein [Salmonella enterica subsp. enterica serovar Lexington]EGY8941124.1 fimbrial protein [Salmonella enterica subsp. diarizonae serovar 60:r:z]HCS9547530.1 fimbrial protein [Salmonell